MPTSGGGIGVPITIPDEAQTVYDQMEELIETPNCAVSLARYAKLINYEEAAFWGVVWENQYLRGCDPLWSENERMNIQIALAEAQQEIEEVIGYPLCQTQVLGVNVNNPRWADQQKYCSSRLVTRYPRIIAPGLLTTEVVGSEVDLSYDGADGIAVAGPVATSATSADEIKIYYPDSPREITPSKISISGGFVTVEIPRYRMVKQEFLNFVEGGVDYSILGNFLSAVDIKRVYIDPTTNATLVRPNCRNNSCANGCTECTQSACIYVRDHFLGVVDVSPANWDADLEEWSTKVICRSNYSLVRLNYVAGIRHIDLKAELAIIRLAHAKMGRPPCQCDKTSQMWHRDYDVTGAVTRERVNCPFGLSTGAWIAYKWAQSMASKRASIF